MPTAHRNARKEALSLPLAVFRYEPPDYEQERRPGRPRPRRDVARWVIMGGVSEDTLEGAKMIQQQQQVIEEIGVRRGEPAYRNGWEDGRFGPTRLFVENPSLAGWAAHHERLAYYRGHRDGRRARTMLSHTDQRA